MQAITVSKWAYEANKRAIAAELKKMGYSDRDIDAHIKKVGSQKRP